VLAAPICPVPHSPGSCRTAPPGVARALQRGLDAAFLWRRGDGEARQCGVPSQEAVGGVGNFAVSKCRKKKRRQGPQTPSPLLSLAIEQPYHFPFEGSKRRVAGEGSETGFSRVGVVFFSFSFADLPD